MPKSSALFALCVILTTAAPHGESRAADCAAFRKALRLDLATPPGCAYEQVFKAQLAVPSDLYRPQRETAAAANRRARQIHDWHDGAAQKPASSDTQK